VLDKQARKVVHNQSWDQQERKVAPSQVIALDQLEHKDALKVADKHKRKQYSLQ
jgi:hypothetical protein